MAAISIVVPVYNTELYVEKCLRSLCIQTFSDIEIICIDDASADNSLEIIKRLSNVDSRIKVLRHEKNLGTLQARKHGVLSSCGKYIMFVDSDDWLEKNACEALYKKMEAEQVDILQFGTNVVPAIPISENMIIWIESFLKPYEQRISGKHILRACFVENKFDFNITDKIWRATLCKEAFCHIEDKRMITSEDRYAFFVLGYYANTYLGVGDAKYYNYNVGIGVTGSDILDLNRFEKRCTGVLAVKEVAAFLMKNNSYKQYIEEYEQFGNKILRDCVDCWYHKLDCQDQGLGYDILLKYWNIDDVLAAIAGMYFEEQKSVLEKTALSKVMLNKPIVGIYYRYLGYEPMDEYIQRKIQVVEQSGYDLCLFSDIDAPLKKWKNLENDLVLLPSSKEANWDNYQMRAKAFCQELNRHNISMMLYASPTSHIYWLDMLLLKSLGIWTLRLDEENEIGLSDMLSKQKECEEEISLLKAYCNQLKESKTYRVGKALLWIPNEIKKLLHNNKEG